MTADSEPVRRVISVFLPTALALLIGCAQGSRQADSADESVAQADTTERHRESGRRIAIRFAVEVVSDVSGPIYVLLNDEDDQPGWIQVFRDSERIYLRERCEIEDCGATPVVCGAAIPRIRDIAGGEERVPVEFEWDGMTSVIDPISECETRVPAPLGNYIARFCYSREAEFEGRGDPTRAVPGGVVHPTCVERPFTLYERQVVLRI